MQIFRLAPFLLPASNDDEAHHIKPSASMYSERTRTAIAARSLAAIAGSSAVCMCTGETQQYSFCAVAHAHNLQDQGG